MKRAITGILAIILWAAPALATQTGTRVLEGNNDRPRVAQTEWSSASGAAASSSGIKATGFWMEGHLGMAMLSIPAGAPTFGSGITVGYKLNRLVVGLGLDLSYDWRKDENGGTTDTDYDLSFALGPVVEYILAQLGPVGFFATGAGHFLFNWHKTKESMNRITVEHSTKTYGFDFKAGVGGRYYLGGRVGLGLELGLAMRFTQGGDVKNFSMGPYTMLTLATIW